MAGAGAGAGAGMKVCGDDRSAQHQSTNRNARGYLEVGIRYIRDNIRFSRERIGKKRLRNDIKRHT